jgi:uncharacterized DUF497 family protein
LLDERVVTIVFTEPEANTIRVISMRRATRDERQRFFEAISN